MKRAKLVNALFLLGARDRGNEYAAEYEIDTNHLSIIRVMWQLPKSTKLLHKIRVYWGPVSKTTSLRSQRQFDTADMAYKHIMRLLKKDEELHDQKRIPK